MAGEGNFRDLFLLLKNDAVIGDILEKKCIGITADGAAANWLTATKLKIAVTAWCSSHGCNLVVGDLWNEIEPRKLPKAQKHIVSLFQSLYNFMHKSKHATRDTRFWCSLFGEKGFAESKLCVVATRWSSAVDPLSCFITRFQGIVQFLRQTARLSSKKQSRQWAKKNIEKLNSKRVVAMALLGDMSNIVLVALKKTEKELVGGRLSIRVQRAVRYSLRSYVSKITDELNWMDDDVEEHVPYRGSGYNFLLDQLYDKIKKNPDHFSFNDFYISERTAPDNFSMDIKLTDEAFSFQYVKTLSQTLLNRAEESLNSHIAENARCASWDSLMDLSDAHVDKVESNTRWHSNLKYFQKMFHMEYAGSALSLQLWGELRVEALAEFEKLKEDSGTPSSQKEDRAWKMVFHGIHPGTGRQTKKMNTLMELKKLLHIYFITMASSACIERDFSVRFIFRCKGQDAVKHLLGNFLLY